MVERLAVGLAVVVALSVTASIASAQFQDGDGASHSISTDSLQPPTDPAATNGLCVAGVGASIVVSWAATVSSWADGYEILGSPVSGGPYATVGTVSGANTTSYTATGLAFSTTYHYVVKATKANWRSSQTSEVSSTTPSSLCL